MLKLTDKEEAMLREQPIPMATRAELIDAFHRLSYDEARRDRSWHATRWRGTKVFKWPGDLWLYVELIQELKPGTIIETGTAQGGSAYLFADLLELNRRGMVVTIDLNPIQGSYPAHKRINYVPQTSSLDWQAPRDLLEPVMIVLDSDHSRDHVLKELERYAPGVSRGSYLVLEDSNVGGHPCNPEHGPGPHEALAEWLPQHPEFRRDEHKASKYLFSYHTWLKRSE